MKKRLIILAIFSVVMFGYSIQAWAPEQITDCNITASCVESGEQYSITYEVTANTLPGPLNVNYALIITGPSELPPVTGTFTAGTGSGSGSISVSGCGDYVITGSVELAIYPGIYMCTLGPLTVRCPCEMLEGCTPGYWKNIRKHGDEWAVAGYDPNDLFIEIFGFGSRDLTLGEAIRAKGGQLNKLLRFSTAALLNAAHPDVQPDSSVDTVGEVIDLAYNSFLVLNWDAFDGLVDQDCPLN
ncbi:MAG: hypothetical protein HF978_06215 [Desulfobacteraceae bacterium]|nr:hypothetical protein [Desulfobacteraceae bacterium]MBC2755128.1 hypothetical protein [Desulfobacteraceae bacterium]